MYYILEFFDRTINLIILSWWKLADHILCSNINNAEFWFLTYTFGGQ